MHFALDLLQGIGLAAAIGIRPFLPTLLAGALAAGNLGLDFGGTDFSFLEKWPFLLGILVLVGALELANRRSPDAAKQTSPLVYVVAAVAVVLGALEAAGSLADHGYAILPGVLCGAAAAVLGFVAAHQLFTRVRRRLDAQTAGALPLYGEGAALVAAGASVLFPPLAILVVGALGWLLLGGRRREGEKYAGLRVLR